MRNLGYLGILAIAFPLSGMPSAYAAISGIQRVGANATLNFPSFATHAPGDPNRLFVTELGGSIKVLDLNSNNILGTPFLTIPSVDAAGEGGLLGLAFHPDYLSTDVSNPGRGKFYVYVTIDNGGDDSLGVTSPFSTRIREYTVSGDPATSNIATPTPTRELLSIVRPQDNHVGGWIGFNPQVTPGQPQYLHIASGDGGGGFDNAAGHTPGIGNAQDLSNNLHGKMLRIDVNGDSFPADAARNYAIPSTNPFLAANDATNIKDDEIFAYGLRNPYRNSFDRKTGDLWIGDVGQGQREEIDFLPGSSNGGQNYGWRLREGNEITNNGVGGPAPVDYVAPIYDYTRGAGVLQGETVIGGYRYRGPDPELQGRYFFGDANDLNTWQMIPPNPVVPNTAVTNIDATLGNLTGINRIVSFGEDANGNLYIVDLANNNQPNTGEIYRITTNKLLAGDFDADGVVDQDDYLKWRAGLGSANPNAPSDGNANALFDAADFVAWRNNVGSSVFAGAGVGSAVPEPAAIGLLATSVFAIVLWFGQPRRRTNDA